MKNLKHCKCDFSFTDLEDLKNVILCIFDKHSRIKREYIRTAYIMHFFKKLRLNTKLVH